MCGGGGGGEGGGTMTFLGKQASRYASMICNRTCGQFLNKYLVSGGKLEIVSERHRHWNKQLSLVFFMYCAFQCSSRCVQNHYNRPLHIQ